MAEELQRYNSQGVQFRIPKVEFTASRVQAQTMASLQQSLDRMSNFFFNYAEGQAKIEGAEFGAENAPTKEQIQASVDSGEPLEIPGDKFTVYGQYARNASLTAVTDQIDYMVSTELSKTSKLFNESLDKPGNNPEFEPDKMLEKFQSIIEGYASALDDVSPGTGKKLRASAGIQANAKYVSYADKWSNNEFLKSKSQFFAEIEIQKEQLADEIFAHANNPEMLDFLINTMRSKLLAKGSTFKLSQGELQNISDKFNKNLKDVAMKVMQDEILKSESIPGMEGKMLEELLKNPESQNISQEMKASLNVLENLGESRKQIVKELFNEHLAKTNFEQNQEQAQINDNVREVKDALAQAVTKWFRGEKEEAEAIMGDYITANGAVILDGTGSQIEAWAKFKETENGTDKKDVDQVVLQLEAMGTNLTTERVLEEFNAGNLSKATASGFINDAQKFADEKYKRAVKNVIYPAFKFEENVIIQDPKGKDKLNIELKNQAMAVITAEYEQSLIDGTTQDIDWQSRAKKIVDDINKIQKPEAEKIEKGKAVSLIKQVLTQVQDQNLKNQYADITNENITEDQIKSFFNILTLVKKEIDDPTDLPPLEGIIGFRERGPDTIPPYIRTLTTKYKNSTNLLDSQINILKETLTIFRDD